MSRNSELVNRLMSCPAGIAGWKTFEDICIDILTCLFVPPLQLPSIQPRTFSGIDRRDAIFPNRVRNVANNWGLLFHDHAARMILVEFKNYESEDIGKDEVNQVEGYMTEPMGRLALLVCNKPPNDAAHIRRNAIYSDRHNKVILFLTKYHLKEMLYRQEAGFEPSDVLLDLIEQFIIQHE